MRLRGSLHSWLPHHSRFQPRRVREHEPRRKHASLQVAARWGGRGTVGSGGAGALRGESWADQLRRNKKTREAVVEQYRGEQSVQCEGVASGMMIAPVEVATIFKVGFETVPLGSATAK